MAGPGNIIIKIGASAGQAVSELTTVNRALGDTMTTSEKMGAGLRKAALPAAAALGVLAVGAVDAAKAAMEDATAHDHLVSSLQRTTNATEAQANAADDWISKLSLSTGVADDDLRPALEKLATATGSVTSAQGFLKQALDISAATGKDVVTVSTAIAKAHEGQTASLAKLVPGLSEAARTSKDFGVIMDEIQQKTGGAMADSAATAAGQYQIFNNQMQELKETLGASLLPIIQAFLPLLNKFATFASENTTAIKILVGIIAGLSAGVLVANAAMKVYAAGQTVVKAATAAWTAAQWLLNAALTANPIGLVIVAIAALGAALVVAYLKSQTFREIVQAALGAVKTAAQALANAFETAKDAAAAAFNWIIAHWKLGLFAFGPIGVAVLLIVDNFRTLQNVASSVFAAINSAISGVSSTIYGVISAVESLISALGRIHVPSIHLPHIPGVNVAPAPAAAQLGAGGRSTSSGVTVNVYGAIDPEGTARQIRRILGDSDRRRGR